MNRSKAKGTAFESDVVGYLNEHGFPLAERRTLSGSHDKGDISGVPGWTIEVKNCKEMLLAAWVDEATVEAANAGTTNFCAVHKRRGKNVSEAYVTLPLRVLCEVIA